MFLYSECAIIIIFLITAVCTAVVCLPFEINLSKNNLKFSSYLIALIAPKKTEPLYNTEPALLILDFDCIEVPELLSIGSNPDKDDLHLGIL